MAAGRALRAQIRQRGAVATSGRHLDEAATLHVQGVSRSFMKNRPPPSTVARRQAARCRVPGRRSKREILRATSETSPGAPRYNPGFPVGERRQPTGLLGVFHGVGRGTLRANGHRAQIPRNLWQPVGRRARREVIRREALHVVFQTRIALRGGENLPPLIEYLHDSFARTGAPGAEGRGARRQ